MVNTQNEGFIPEDEQQEDNSDQLQEHTGTVFGSFENADREAADTSNPDEEAGEEDEEDEPAEDVSGSSPGAGFVDATNEAGGQRGNSGGPIGNLSGEYDTNSSSAGGSGTMEK